MPKSGPRKSSRTINVGLSNENGTSHSDSAILFWLDPAIDQLSILIFGTVDNPLNAALPKTLVVQDPPREHAGGA